MQVLQTVLLRHRMRGGDHYDWMLEAPAESSAAESGKLLTWRVGAASWQWRGRGCGEGWRETSGDAAGRGREACGVMTMEELIAHRRAYLRRTGPISGGRGSVQRVDAGTAIVHQWHDSGGCLELRLRHFCGRIELQRGPAMRWRMRVVG